MQSFIQRKDRIDRAMLTNVRTQGPKIEKLNKTVIQSLGKLQSMTFFQIKEKIGDLMSQFDDILGSSEEEHLPFSLKRKKSYKMRK